MPDTFVTASPQWAWFIIPYFFIGGIAGAVYWLAAMLEWAGRPEDRPVIRSAYSIAFWGSVVCAVLLTIDLGRPLRFWHMLFESDNFPRLAFKSWSPISFGAWALLLFGGCAFISWRSKTPGSVTKMVATIGGFPIGLILAGYTGVLLSVTNRPIWAESPWLGALFLASSASTGAATLRLLAARRDASAGLLAWLESFDRRALVFELIILLLFVGWLWPIRQIWLSFWGVLLLVGVIWAGIIWPLTLQRRPAAAGAFRNPAVMVLLGGFLLRVVIVLASNGIQHETVAANAR